MVTTLLWCGAAAQRLSYGPDNEFADFKVSRDQLGGRAELQCNSSSRQWEERLNNSSPVSWILRVPDLKILDHSQGRYELLNDNLTLVIHNLTVGDLGQYHCMLKDESGHLELIKVGLNLGGPYFQSGWDEYWLNTVIGLSSFFGFLLLTAIVIAIYLYQWIPPTEAQPEMFTVEISGDKPVDVNYTSQPGELDEEKVSLRFRKNTVAPIADDGLEMSAGSINPSFVDVPLDDSGTVVGKGTPAGDTAAEVSGVGSPIDVTKV